MDRREFVKFLALIAAGTAALPEQIMAFERYYEANTPQLGKDFVAIDEIFISGMATKSTPMTFELASPPMSIGINLFGGIMRWVAAADQKIIRPRLEVSWSLKPEVDTDIVVGHVSFVDQNAKRHFQPITAMSL